MFAELQKRYIMVIKLKASDYILRHFPTTTEKKKLSALKKADWVKVDRIILALMYLIAIAGSLIFN